MKRRGIAGQTQGLTVNASFGYGFHRVRDGRAVAVSLSLRRTIPESCANHRAPGLRNERGPYGRQGRWYEGTPKSATRMIIL